MAESSIDTLLHTVPTLPQAQALRKHLMNGEERLWLFVSKNNDEKYDISAVTANGGRLQEDVIAWVREDCVNFMKGFPEPVIELGDEDLLEVDGTVGTVEVQP